MTTTAPPPVEVEPGVDHEVPERQVAGPVVPGEDRATLSADAGGRGVPNAWRRAMRGRSLEDPFIGWTASLGVTLFALFLRLWHLSSPKLFEFDETYYAKDAWSLIHFGYARDYKTGADDKILAGHTTDQWLSTPSMVVHPEVGKWIIGAGESVFGMTPFGWRIASAIVGSLMVLVMCRLAKRLTGSTALGVVAGFLLSFDGLQLVLSRLALLDIFQAFFTLLAVHLMVVDRDWYRAKLARMVPATLGGDRLEPDASAWGPVRGLLFRPWLLLSGITWGLACGTKWASIYPLAVFGIMVWLWSAGARRSFGVRWSTAKSALVDGVPAFFHLVFVAFVVYVATWTGWLIHAHTYEEHLSNTQYTSYSGHGHCGGPKGTDFIDDHPRTDAQWPTATQPDAHGLGEVVQSLRSLYYFHQDVETFHAHFLNCATHPYQSKPSGWPLLNRPVGVAADNGIQPGTRGCTARTGSDCLRQVLLIGTPALWWGGCLALLFALVMWVGGRDWRFGLCVLGFVSTWWPWTQFDDRPIFLFYAVNMLPFLVLAVTLTMGKLIGPSTLPSTRRTVGVIVSGSFFVLVLANFAWFWPIFTNGLLTHSQWLERIWFARWI